MCERGNAHEYFCACYEIFVCYNDVVDCLGNLRQVTFDLPQAALDLLGKQTVRRSGKPRFCSGPVFDQCQPGGSQLLES
jgi:hypothetical protein